MAPLTAREHLLGDLSHCAVGIALRAALGDAKRAAEHEQRVLSPDLVAQLRELIGAQVLRGRVDEIALGGMALLPVDRVARRVGEAFQLASVHSQIVCGTTPISKSVRKRLNAGTPFVLSLPHRILFSATWSL